MAAYTTIDDPEAYFQIELYTGTGSSHAITFDGDTDMQPDLVWIKARDDAESHNLYDAVRGTTKHIETDTDQVENTEATSLTAFGSDGFTVGAYSSINNTDGLYVAWNWKESATAGFDIVSYTGNGTDDTDISHNLSAVPHVIMVKNLTEAYGWNVYHHKNTSAPETDVLSLDTTAATYDTANSWSDEAPTSSVFTLGGGNGVNKNTNAMIAYLWSEKQGFSKFGSYTGNGNADGVFIYLGFKPAWFLCKNTQDAGDNWILHDNKRDTFNVTDNGLAPNSNEVEFTDVDMDFLSNGVKMRNNTGRANSAKTFLYMAFAEAPFVNSNGVPCNAR